MARGAPHLNHIQDGRATMNYLTRAFSDKLGQSLGPNLLSVKY